MRIARTSATQNIETSTTTPSFLFETNMSEMASPAAVVEILITQNNTVTSGTFAASGCWLNTRSTDRTIVLSPFSCAAPVERHATW